MNMKLYIGNKTYSSWSMRPWVLLRALEIPFEEVLIPFDGFEPTSQFKQAVAGLHPLATVPVLEVPDSAGAPLIIADSLSITEYLAEAFADRGVWPEARSERAAARQVVAAMHSGYGVLRDLCPMNIGVDLSEVGEKLLADNPSLAADIERLESVLSPFLEGGAFLFGDFSAADAFYVPVMMRIKTYGLGVSGAMRAYQGRVLGHWAVEDWVSEALAEERFLDFEEPYRSGPEDGKPW